MIMIVSSHSVPSTEQGDKDDIYLIGQILLEVITGKPTESPKDLDSLKTQVNWEWFHIRVKNTSHQQIPNLFTPSQN